MHEVPERITQQLDPSVVHALVPRPFDSEALMALVRNIIEANRAKDRDDR